MTDQLCTTAQVKGRIFQGGTSDGVDDALISELIDQCSTWITNYTGRKFAPDNAATYVFDTVEGNVLRVPYGVRSITSMGVNNTAHQPDSAGSYTTIPAADIILRPKAQDAPQGWPYFEVRITRGTITGTITHFGRIDNGCTITGNFGFASTPPDIVAVAIDAVVAAYAARGNPASAVIGADDIPVAPWASFFMKRSPQRATLDRYAVWG